jgi:peptidylprolyl isomerase
MLIFGLVIMTALKNGDIIDVRYTGWKKRTGEVFDSNDKSGMQPLRATIGAREFISGFNEALLGMSEGETKQVEIPVNKAYGQRNPNLITVVPRAQLLGKVVPKVGKVLALKAATGGIVPGMITEITDSDVIIDLNPPLAGEDLVFKIRIENIVRIV